MGKINNGDITIAYHPGEYLLEEIGARGRSQTQFSEILWIDKSEINNLIKGRRNITARLAFRIGSAFKTSPEVWLWLQNMYDLYVLSQNKEEIKKINLIPKRAEEIITV